MIHKRSSKLIFYAGGIASLFIWVRVFAMVQLPSDMHEMALASIHNVYTDGFKSAEHDAKKIIKMYPEHPAGYFFYAAVLNSYMEYLQSEKYEIEFYQNCDLAILKGENMLEREPDNAWAKFFVGGANGLKGTYESRYERWITAFKHGWRGVAIFKELLETNPEMEDARYGIAAYNYWRSAKTKLLWWLPGVEDKRDVAISELKKIRKIGIYVQQNASMVLIDIFHNEERYGEALEVASSMLAQYPTNLICWWGKAKSELGLKKYSDAEESFRYILTRIQADAFDNNYNIVLCHYYLLKTFFNQKIYGKCIEEFTKMSKHKLSNISQKRLENYVKDAEDMVRKAKRSLGKR